MNTNTVIVFVLSFFAAINTAHAAFSDPAAASASAMLPATILTEDLSAGDISLHPTAGYLTAHEKTGTEGNVSLHGVGGSLTLTKALGPHLGVSIGGLYFNESGNYDPGATGVAGTAGTASATGWLGSAGLVIDPFSGNGFRMPILIGGNYENFHTSIPTEFNSTGTTLRSPGYSFGISPRFSVGWFRVQPFFMLDIPTNKATNACNPSSTSCPATSSIDTGGILGVNLIFIPWGLSLFYNFANLIYNEGSSYLSLGYRF